MYSLLTEEISQGHGKALSQAARLLPSSRKGRPVTLSCLVRWILHGVQNADGQRVHLEAARLAGRWITTPQAIARFIQAQTPQLDHRGDTPRSPAARARASRRAEQQLEELGI